MLQFMLNKKTLTIILFLFLVLNMFAYQLGSSDVPYQTTPIKIADDVRYVGANRYQTFIVKNDNSLWLSGEIDSSKVLPPSETNLYKGFVKIFDNVKEIAVYDSSIMILTTDSKLYCLGEIPIKAHIGAYSYVELEYVKEPVYIDNDVKKITVALNFFAYIKEDNSVYFFGKLNETKDGITVTPKKLSCKAIDISHNIWTLLILTEKNELLSTSDGVNFTKIATNVKKVSRDMFLKEDFTLYAFDLFYLPECAETGSHGVKINDANTPELVMTDVKDMFFNSWHSLIIKTNGDLYSCGGFFSEKRPTEYSYLGFIGDGSQKPQFIPVKIAEDVIFCTASDFTTFFITEDSSLWGCGLNSYDETVLYM